MKLLNNFAIYFAALSFTTFTFAEVPDHVAIKDGYLVGGTGCANGAGEVTLSSDFSSLYFSIDQIEGRAGAGISLRENRKSCQMAPILDVTEGWTFAVRRLSGLGYASVAAGATAKQTIDVGFQAANRNSYVTNIVGPSTQAIRTNIIVPQEELLFAPCDRERAFNLKLSVEAKADAFIAYDAGWREFIRADLVWKRCP